MRFHPSAKAQGFPMPDWYKENRFKKTDDGCGSETVNASLKQEQRMKNGSTSGILKREQTHSRRLRR